MCILWYFDVFSTLTPQTELKRELIPLKSNLRRLYEAKQECDDTTVHMKVSINTKIHETVEDLQDADGTGRLKLSLVLFVCKHIRQGARRDSFKCTLMSTLISCVLEPDSGHREADQRGVWAAPRVSAEGGGSPTSCPAAGIRWEERASEEEDREHH